jgi:DUF4097 and DUF4098 domain-containing protein YvlB
MDKRFSTPEPVELVIELGSGTITTEAGATSESTVAVDGPRADEFIVELRGRELSVIAPRHRTGMFGGNDRHDVRVTVPEGSDLSTRTGSASTRAEGHYGMVRAKTGSGDIEIDAARSAVVVDSGSGDVRCDMVGADLRVKSGSGDVEIDAVHGAGTISTGSGDVALGHTGGPTVVKTGSGETRIGHLGADLTVTTGSGTTIIAHAERGSVRTRSGSGDIRVGVPAGTPVWTDISSATGRIASDLTPLGKPDEGQDHVELRLRTGSGDIVLSQVPGPSAPQS